MKRIIAALLAAVTVLSLFSACKKTETTVDETTVSEEDGKKEPQTPENGDKDEPIVHKFPYELKAEAVGKIEYSYIEPASLGVKYSKDGKYGFIANDTGYDSGAIFSQLNSFGKFFYGTTKADKPSKADEYNRFGLWNEDGTKVLEEKYAMIKKLNDRYISTFVASEITDVKTADSGVPEDKAFTVVPGCTYYIKGQWEIFDTNTMKFVEGLSGKNRFNEITAFGDFISYYDENNVKNIVNDKNKPVPEKSTVFDDGSYFVRGEDIGTVYDTKGKALFTCQVGEFNFTPQYVSGDYFVMAKYTNNERSEKVYKLANKKGSFVSVEFPGTRTFNEIQVYGNVVALYNAKSENKNHWKLYDMNGNFIIDCQSVYTDSAYGGCILASSGDKYTHIDADTAKIIAQFDADAVKVNIFNLQVTKEIDGVEYAYCFKDKDFTIKNAGVTGPWTASVKGAENKRDLINTITGEALIKDYVTYYLQGSNDGRCFVYAQNTKGFFDVYVIK